MILVLDESGSIGTSKATDQVKNAARAFLTPLAGTGSKVAVVEFSTAAHLGVAYQTVTAETIASKFEPYLKNEYSPAGWTNWEGRSSPVEEDERCTAEGGSRRVRYGRRSDRL